MVTGIHHISIKTNSVDKFNQTIEFYCKYFNFKMLRSWGECNNLGCMIQLENIILEITIKDVSYSQGMISHIAFLDHDINKTYEILKNDGYEFFIEPTDKFLSYDYKVRIAFFNGINGEQIELIQELDI